jgi:hypothetical protein
MKRVGGCVINLVFACAIVFSVKTIADTSTACDHCLPEHSITGSTHTSYALFKQLFPEPFVIRYRVDGIPARRIGGYICAQSAFFMARDFDNPGGVLRVRPVEDRRPAIKVLMP